ncbi:L-idonate 5-dehydrogenase [Mycetocola tolaasinivorans]|uniref:L-idonate 5-dehydrogenase n=1 Tax=Mycetocola tolaasinivorans TaxID=76635 RepID=A0A3L7AE66_9MICO|nr:L-idonate 5-dehydrogenase [Mycetocola tolaasinivorans]RLP77998.1 L-idonate 5-dehydrogenase [Mycetocola tolaasinivorans]
MKAVTVHSAGDLRVDEIPDPTPGPGEALVRMEWGGICGSDIAYWRSGISGTAVLTEPMILGHEVAGTVLAFGAAADGGEVVSRDGITPGTAVTIHPASIAEGSVLSPELAGRDNLHSRVRYFGSAAFTPHTQGGFSTLRVVPVEQLRALPTGLSTRTASVAEPLGVAMHAVTRAGSLVGKRVLVNGAGPIGALVVAAAVHAGADTVYASDVAESSLDIAGRMGAHVLINRAAGDSLPEDVDVSFEASGVPATVGDVLAATARGGIVVQVGNLPTGNVSVSLGALVSREIDYRGTYRFAGEFDAAIALLAAGLNVDPLLTHEFSIDEALTAFETAADRSTGSSKVLLRLADTEASAA